MAFPSLTSYYLPALGGSGALGFDLKDLPLLVSQARTILPSDVLIQIPPNLVLRNSNSESDSFEAVDCMNSDGGDDVIRNSRKCSDSDDVQRCSKTKRLTKNEEDNQKMTMESERNDFLISLLDAGARDFGGISPLDEVNPTYSFQKVQQLKSQLELGDYELVQRLPVYERHFYLLNSRVKNVIDNQYSNFYSRSG